MFINFLEIVRIYEHLDLSVSVQYFKTLNTKSQEYHIIRLQQALSS